MSFNCHYFLQRPVHKNCFHQKNRALFITFFKSKHHRFSCDWPIRPCFLPDFYGERRLDRASLRHRSHGGARSCMRGLWLLSLFLQFFSSPVHDKEKPCGAPGPLRLLASVPLNFSFLLPMSPVTFDSRRVTSIDTTLIDTTCSVNNFL